MTDTNTFFSVEHDKAGERLDRFLVEAIGCSRSAAQRLLKQNCIHIEGVKPLAHTPVREGWHITVLTPHEPPRRMVPDPSVVAETEDYLVIDKPAGLLVHPAAGTHEPTLVDWLLRHVPAIASVGEPDRPGIVHRLDRDVSGLLVIAKNASSYDHLRAAFHDRHIQKTYTALVIGNVASDEGEIRLRIARSKRRNGRMAARPESGEGREALTRYSVLQRFRTTTLLSVEIATGRTHQIRAHLFGIGHPIYGDQLYRAKHIPHLPPISRPFLHATRLGFIDTDGSLREFTSELPEELRTILTNIAV